MTAHLSILVATTNRGKMAEFRGIFAGLPVELMGFSTVLPGRAQVIEDGATFEDNAILKARDAAAATTMITIAEDAGLEVDALGGRPGVRSARFARDGATDAENNAALLSALQDVEDDARTARFRSVLVLCDPWNEVQPLTITDGRCEGRIAREARGTGGFGYDPLFLLANDRRTMAELSDAEKNHVSHRARAARALIPAIEALLRSRVEHAQRITTYG